MKRVTAMSLALVIALGSLTACGSNEDTSSSSVVSTESSSDAATDEAVVEEQDVVNAGDWAGYDALIEEIKSTTDYTVREALMHEAEAMLMETGAIIPLYFYNDLYMQKSTVTNIYSNLYGFKYFMFAETPSTTLRINLASEPDYLDPAKTTSVDGACLVVNTFAGLFTYDQNLNPVPDLVADYTVSEDGITYTFNLLPDLKWSDGSELNANDFVYSWNRVVAEATAADYSYMFDAIARKDDGTLNVVASEDGQSLTVVLASPCAYFFDLCAFPAYYPVKQSVVEAQADWETNPASWTLNGTFVSNGAYSLTSWSHEKSMTYTKNPYYHKADEVNVETLEYMLSADDTAIFAAYNAGNLDFIDTVPTDEIQNLLDNPEFNVVNNLGTYYVSVNVKSSLFDGKTPAQANAMRRALSLLIDREYIAENIGQTGQEPANSFIPAGMADGNGGVFKTNDSEYTYPAEESTGYFDPTYSSENVDEAIALLEEAGYVFSDGMLSSDTPITFEYLTNDTSGHIAIAEAIQQDFAAIGINMSIKSCDWNVFLAERKAGNYDICRNGWLADFNDPVNMLEMWTTDSGNNDIQFGR